MFYWVLDRFCVVCKSRLSIIREYTKENMYIFIYLNGDIDAFVFIWFVVSVLPMYFLQSFHKKNVMEFYVLYHMN